MDSMGLHRLLTAAALAAVVVAGPMIAWSQESEPGAGGSAFIQRFDQDADGLVSADEFPGNQKQFQCLDLDGDGYLDSAEAPKGPPHGPGQPEDILAEFDADNDGYLSAEEFPGPEDHFEDLDTDGDGFLNQEELLAGRPGPPVGGGFERDDVDQDGRVSQSEFSGPAGLFARLDQDGDGYITQDEARSGRPGRDPERAPEIEPRQP